MARISLKEAYDNRDVIAWLVKHEDEIDELMNILKDIDPSGDLTNIVTKTGDQTIDGIKTFIGKIVADCDIIQNGGNYETHAEQVFTTNDYIVMRDGAVSGLGTGQFSGFQVKKYNGSDDGRLVIDNAGVARVGDIGDEQPLMTRDEAANLAGGDVLLWDSVNQKAIGQAKDSTPASGSTALVTSDGIYQALANKTNTLLSNSGTVTVTNGASGDSSSITVSETGTYLIIARGEWTSNNNGDRYLGLYFGGQQKWLSCMKAVDESYDSASAVYDLSSGTTISIRGFQNSGSSLSHATSLKLIKLI